MALAQSSLKCRLRFSLRAALTAVMIIIISNTITRGDMMIMTEEGCVIPVVALLRQQTWLSPAFPTGAYSYSHGIEWAIEAGHIYNRETLVDWLESDLRYGSGRNEAIFFTEAWRSASEDDRSRLLRVAELAAV